MSGEKYMGLDVHQATISVAVVDSQGKVVMESILETKADLQQTGAGNPRQRGISLRGWASAAAQKTGDDSRLEQIWGRASVLLKVLFVRMGHIILILQAEEASHQYGQFPITKVQCPVRKEASEVTLIVGD